MSVETVVVHEIWQVRVWGARPMYLVRDEGDFVALWFPRGTVWKAPITPPTREREADRGVRLAECALRGDWVHRDQVWDVDTLVLMRAGEWHAIWVSWLPGGEHYGWYVNLQRPFERTRCGFETMDMTLDLIINPDRSWYWKDEDELEAWVARGVCPPDLAERLREEGLAVARRAELDEPPFCEPWHEWRPDPSWPLPELPPGWEQRCR
jgi:hypothetical protein